MTREEEIAYLFGKITGGLTGLLALAKDKSCSTAVEEKISSLLDMVLADVSEIYYSKDSTIDRELPNSLQESIKKLMEGDCDR